MGASTDESNFNVIVRVRPLSTHSSNEKKADRNVKITSTMAGEQESLGAFTLDANRTISVLDESIILFDPSIGDAKKPLYSTRRKKGAKYAFDRVFGETASQIQVYEYSGLPLLDSVLQGYNATLFAYGATGCGKTHTIVGSPKDPGIIYLAMRDLFAKIQVLSQERMFDVSLSYLEVYNETIRDLLNPDHQGPLELREDDNHIVVSGLSEHSPTCAEQVLQMLVDGNENRTKASTQMNAVSSRSHAVLQVRIRQRDKVTGTCASWTHAILSIIDLAGSERASATKNRGERLVEGANINRSLLALGNCINALCSESRSKNHIPYRDSKLTRLLKYSLSGNCKVVMIANVSPTILQAEETHNTLKYANRAKNIRIKADKNVVDIAYQISQYPLIIEALKSEIHELKKRSENTAAICESDQVDELYHEALKLIRKLYAKIKEKHLGRVDIQAKLDWNAYSLQHLEGLNQDIGATHLADHLDAMNTTLRHNMEEIKAAVERYEAQLRERLDKICFSMNTGLVRKLGQEKRLEGLLIQVQVMEHQLQLASQQSEALSEVTRNLVRLFVSSSKSDEEKRMSLLSVLMPDAINQSTASVDVFYDSCTDVSDTESGVSQSSVDRQPVSGDELVVTSALPHDLEPRPVMKTNSVTTPIRSRLRSRDSTIKTSTMKKKRGQENPAVSDPDLTPVAARYRTTTRTPLRPSSILRILTKQHEAPSGAASPRSVKRLKRRDSMIPQLPSQPNRGSALKQDIGPRATPHTTNRSREIHSSLRKPLVRLTEESVAPIRRSQRQPGRRMSMLPIPK